MNKQQKQAVVDRLHEKFSRAKVSILTEYSGMRVEEMQRVKNTLRPVKCEFKVVKNRLAQRAAVGTSLEKVSEYFKGPVALTLGFDDVVLPVKLLDGMLSSYDKLKIKIGVIESRVVDRAGVKAVASLPSRPILLSQLSGRLQSPLSGFAGVLGGILSQVARVLQAAHTARVQQEK